MSIGRIGRFLRRVLLQHASPEFILFLKHLRSSGMSAFPFGRQATVCRSVSKKSVLVLAPHPDDEVVGLGGTLSMHLAVGSEVTVVYMTDGGFADPTSDPMDMAVIRRTEAESLGELFGFHQVFLGNRDSGLTANSETVGQLGEVLKKVRPDSVFVPSPIDAHRDHFAANEILTNSLTILGSWDVEVFGYEIWTDIPFPNHVVDITSVFAQKLEMISHYGSQLALCDYRRFARSKNALNYLRHAHPLEEGYAEAFIRYSAVNYCRIVQDLMGGKHL